VNEKARVCQVALSVEDLEKSTHFYKVVFSLKDAGGTDEFRGDAAERVQGIPGVASRVKWLVDDRELFQLELFQFESPLPKQYGANRDPSDIGYSRIAFDVADLDAAIARVKSNGGSTLAGPDGQGEQRSGMCKDPDGILIQLIETSLPDGLFARLSGIALSVPDLDIAVQDFENGLGLRRKDVDSLPCCSIEEEGIEKRQCIFDGITLWLEISQYEQPASRPWPEDYRLCDYGILNIALGYRDEQALYNRIEAAKQAGFRLNSEPETAPGLVVVYTNDRQNFSVEMLSIVPEMDGHFGFSITPDE